MDEDRGVTEQNSQAVNHWDESWRCPAGCSGIAMGAGKRGGGNATVTFDRPPRCHCGREMEQGSIGIEPEDCQ